MRFVSHHGKFQILFAAIPNLVPLTLSRDLIVIPRRTLKKNVCLLYAIWVTAMAMLFGSTLLAQELPKFVDEDFDDFTQGTLTTVDTTFL